MKVVILCGGLGTRISEETHIKPKPMVEIGGQPILWHIMNYYASFGFKEFVLALGYKSEVIKEYFLNYYALRSDFTVDLGSGDIDYIERPKVDWKISLVDTGLNTLTGGRILRLKEHLKHDTFMLTYGDGVADVDLSELLKFHRQHGKYSTVTAVRPAARFGEMILKDNTVETFQEKPQAGEGWINGGFFVMEPSVFDYFKEGDETILERGPLEGLTKDRELMAFEHSGFWQCMDTLRDKNYLEDLYSKNTAPWVPNRR
ncbi:MAG: glucose-1-phosphate cytidylyltransferase [Sphingobacteriales bacterium]|nr:MAG: glucose-1-phosphate cytidylyltransferase [Sphingobacteriales bacterium]